MDRNPYDPPRSNTDDVVSPAPQGEVLYAKLGVRFRAFLIDYFLVLGMFVLVAVVGGHLDGVPGAGAVLLVSWFVFAFSYEPLMVWRTGGTIGHHLKNIRVVSEKTGGNPTLLAAFVRNVVKIVLGMLSFANMMISDRQQALHDAAVKVTVRIRNKDLALTRDYIRAPKP